jgi:2',3'-cyclic-nucleotide 2'-phosphodiesterase (5'-nucleotidase family)
MKNNFYILILFFLISSCTKHFAPAQYQFEEKKITIQSPKDEKMWSEILPYKDSLDKQMNVMLAVSDTILTKTSGESDLGNLMCDLVLKKSRDYCNCKVDFTFLNTGGIRLPNLPKGNIALGQMIELMPFDNRVAIMKVNGKTVDTLFNYMASKGGWPVSGARYKIKDKKAFAVEINGAPLDVNKSYVMAVSDYLAQGGDNCDMLKSIPFTDTKKILRDALIEGLKEMNARGEHVKSIIDGRVQKVE